MGAVVRELYVFRQRGQPGEAVESAWFRRGIGMEGDRHAAGGERQTSLLAGETRDWMEKQSPGMEKSVFQSVFTMKKEFSAAFRQEPYFWK